MTVIDDALCAFSLLKPQGEGGTAGAFAQSMKETLLDFTSSAKHKIKQQFNYRRGHLLT